MLRLKADAMHEGKPIIGMPETCLPVFGTQTEKLVTANGKTVEFNSKDAPVLWFPYTLVITDGRVSLIQMPDTSGGGGTFGSGAGGTVGQGYGQ